MPKDAWRTASAAYQKVMRRARAYTPPLNKRKKKRHKPAQERALPLDKQRYLVPAGTPCSVRREDSSYGRVHTTTKDSEFVCTASVRKQGAFTIYEFIKDGWVLVVNERYVTFLGEGKR